MAIGVGVIGGGKHGARYLQHVGEVPGLQLAALCRRNRTAGAAQAAAHGCRFHAEPEHLIDDPDVGVVVLVVPPTLNVHLALGAAHARKPLLIEKPLAPRLDDCRAIAAAASAAGVPVMVAHTLRFNAAVQAIRTAVPSIGPLHAVTLTQRFEPSTLPWLDRRAEAGGGIILHTGVHSFDLLRYLTGEEPRRVHAHASQIVTEQTEDTFAAVVEAESPAFIALVGGSRATAGRSGEIVLAGRDGQLTGDHVHGHAARLVGTRREPLPVGEPVATVRATLVELEASLREQRAPSITLADGAASVALAEACYRSLGSERPEAVERL